jgi:hypothetical protein
MTQMGYMRNIYTLILFLFTLPAAAQKNFSYIDEYRFTERKGEEKMVILAMPIGKSDIIAFTGDTSALRSAGPLIIDVVCTDYPANAPLTALNQKRFGELFRRFPYLKNNTLQQVNFFRQLNGSTSASASKMFHGLVIKFRTMQSPATIKYDLDKLDELLAIAIPPTPSEKDDAGTEPDESDEYRTKEAFRKGPQISSNNDVTVYQQGRYVLVDPRQAVTDLQLQGKLKTDTVKWIRGREIYSYFTPGSPYAALLQKSNVEVPIIITGKKDWFRAVIGEAPAPKRKARSINIDSIGKPGYKPTLPDSTILETFRRNNWNNMVVLADVTGSMYPYSAQLLIWIKINLEKTGEGKYIFFNDGDGKPEREKIPGNSGGIYSKVCRSFEEAKELVKSTMRKGNGGDVPENNIEALIRAEKDFPDAGFNVMIADNWAPVKDKILINRLTKPVRIILCGVYENGINIDYLNLARLTKGSLHLKDVDLVNIALMNEGETLNIKNRSYKIVNGIFEDITDERSTFKKP